MLNPAAPNRKRKIEITYITDDDGEMEIQLDAEGFEEDPRMVPLFLSATLHTLESGSLVTKEH